MDTQLVTYIDRFGESEIKEFHSFLAKNLSETFGGIHLLPFFYPIDGKDAGYDPKDNGVVDHRLGSWDDIKNLSNDFELMADLIVNHISADSPQFIDVKKQGSQSKFFDLFLTKDKVFSENQQDEIEKIIKISNELPFTEIETDTGEKFEFWTTFSSNQIDIDVNSTEGKRYIKNTLKKFADNGIKYVRLDAIGFCIKKAGTKCFLLPETHQFIAELRNLANQLGLTVLIEVHAHFLRQIEAAKFVDYVYDFALPPLVLYSIYSKQFSQLKEWLSMRPNNCFNVLDTHDGIGVNDVQADWEFDGLLTDKEISELINFLHDNTNGESRRASGEAAQNLDVNHINSSFFNALGRNEYYYLTARTIQLLLPGISQIYYAGYLAATNDMQLLEKTNNGRDINRPYYTFEEIIKDLKSPIVKQLTALIQFRNQHPSFNGNFQLVSTNQFILQFEWKNDHHFSTVTINLKSEVTEIKYSDVQSGEVKSMVYGNKV